MIAWFAYSFANSIVLLSAVLYLLISMAKEFKLSTPNSSIFLLLFCVAGIYCCFLSWGVLQERVSTTSYEGEKFTFFIFLNTIQSIVACLVAFLYRSLIKTSKRANAEESSFSLTLQFLKISLLSCLASPFGYESLKHIDYPTLILGKSCKLVPVVVMNFILYRKVLGWKKYAIVGLITLGVSLFMFLDPRQKKTGKENSLFGLALLSINLALDGAYNSSQDFIFHTYKKVDGTLMMMMMNFYSFLIMTAYLVLNPYSSELSAALMFCTRHNQICIDILLFALAGSFGQCFIFLTLERFGSLVLVTVTVTRKMFSIVLSVFLYGHSLSLGQWGSVVLVFIAIIWESAGKISSPKKSEKMAKVAGSSATSTSNLDRQISVSASTRSKRMTVVQESNGTPRRSPRKR